MTRRSGPAGLLARLAGWVAGRPRTVLGAGLVLALAAVAAALTLSTQSVTEALVAEDSPSQADTDRAERVFGGDPIVVVARQDVQQTVLTDDLFQMLRLEGCLGGNPPEGVEPVSPACEELARLRPAKLVTGPASFLNQAVNGLVEVYQRMQRDLGELPNTPEGVEQRQRQLEQIIQLAARYGLTGVPSLADKTFISRVVFDTSAPPGTPKAKLAYLFPSREAAQIIVRLRSDLSESERARAIELIKRAASETRPRMRCGTDGKPAPCFALTEGDYLVSGAPVVIEGLGAAFEGALALLFGVAVALMAVTLLLVFASRWRLLPLAMALASAALTLGLLRLLGGEISLAAIAVLPILVGLAVDYAVQLQARYDEAGEGADPVEAAREAGGRGGPVVASACLATAAGFAVLALSPSPLVREFGLLLVGGVAVSLAVALVLGFAALGLRPPSPPRRPALDRGRIAEGARTAVKSVLGAAIASPGRILLIGALVSACGWIVGTQARTITDIQELVPTRVGVVQDLLALQDAAGSSGEVDVLVEADDLIDPEVVAWMAGLRQRILADAGYDERDPDCARAELCPGPVLTDFLVADGVGMTRGQVREALASLPSEELEGVAPLRADGSLGTTTRLAFSIRSGPLDEQQQLIERMRDEIGAAGGPPAGVSATLVGLPVVAAESADRLADSRYWLVLAGIAAVGLALLVVYRSVSRALLPLVPIVIAGGWSALILGALGVSLNPMSAVLAVLVTAISTEFAVILAGRYREERQGGLDLGGALRRAYGRTGAAVAASGATALAGFAALIASDIRMLRDFGMVAVVDLGVALVGVVIVLPAAIAWMESRATRS